MSSKIENINPRSAGILSWDFLVSEAKVNFNKLAEYMDVNPKYMTYSQDFLVSALNDNKHTAIYTINKVIDRLNSIGS